MITLSVGLGVQLFEKSPKAFSVCRVRAVDGFLQAGTISVDLIEALNKLMLALDELLSTERDELIVVHSRLQMNVP